LPLDYCAMNMRVQFLDASATVIAELHASAHDVGVTIELVEGFEWPAGAERLQILDANGRLVHWQAKADSV
jgi:hypothetical protein